MEKSWPRQELTISYSQIAIFNKGMDTPFSDWKDEHVKQGFAWREGTVSFGTLADDTCEIEVSLNDEVNASEQAVRSIVVPFQVGEKGVTVSSILSKQYDFDIPHGIYELLFEAVPLEPPSANGMFKVRYVFRFTPSAAPKQRVIKHDAELSPPEELVMKAEPAV
ncbi:competence protein ComJ [Aneurinibacillus tyrosinisolvens]|uniref:competence protein ComJ n=1 Tax=Aneurinibacillus tyrosinisolvens TaxID=1443435 RepID=UPI00063F1716|nr:competence protein ComJ [Aneurinibacillus tyrosinisolvens]